MPRKAAQPPPPSIVAPEEEGGLATQVAEKVLKSLEPILENRIGTVQQSVAVVAKLVDMNLNQSDDPKHFLQRNPDIRYTLDAPSDLNRVKALTMSEIMCLLQRAGEPFNQIIRVKHSGQELRFTSKSESAEIRIRAEAWQISTHLGLSVNCGVIPKPYFVCADNVSNELFPKPRDLKDEWSEENQVDINNAFWARKNLILVLFELEHAKKLISDGIFFGDTHFSHVRPFELQSVPKFCYKCYKPNHLRKECQARDFRCGRCAGMHDTQGCDNPAIRCPNCGKEHEAWFPQCSNRQVQSMRALCKEWESQGPSWATMSPREELNGWLKQMTSPSPGPSQSQPVEPKTAPKKGKKKAKASADAPKDQDRRVTRSATAKAAASSTESGDRGQTEGEQRVGKPKGRKNKNSKS
ncbi:uncharacterized protein NECHADRAFT_79871 [Fusarium vanettenii 77-13-4]|uniref:CCHC-type domain-containing protein n=1 Tax=Fusarium vanettenii (strain ATCC MYA-4622 / CBS 123669 / FGSC 9596 / NRRL 45880 / 77-13-4) TaxID=660122 RepID=C7Z0F1_FUSV7|nr:uncharacterized protein NECHADRAFT_79871 [Fusarium vanettenii 77-13-4]EEU42190.1 predicted protein [Fusarium vanettenii 77-13-4]